MFILLCAGADAHRSEADIEGVFLNCSLSTRLGRFSQLIPELSDMVVSLASSLQGAPISPFQAGDYTTEGLNAGPYSCTQMLYPLSHLPTSPKDLTYS